MCQSVYRQTYCELPDGHSGKHTALIPDKPFSWRTEWSYTCPVCRLEKPLDIIYINQLGMCQSCTRPTSFAADGLPRTV